MNFLEQLINLLFNLNKPVDSKTKTKTKRRPKNRPTKSVPVTTPKENLPEEIVPVEEITPTIIQMPLPSFMAGRPDPADIAIIHYSAGYNVQGCYDALFERRISVHESVERDGSIYQHVDHNNRGIHAGYGVWGGKNSINSRSFGVEVINFGEGYEGDGMPSPHGKYGPPDDELIPTPNEVWYRVETYGQTSTRVLTRQKMKSFPDHREGSSGRMWALYPEAQVKSTHWLVWEWMKHSPNIILENVIGHEHVTPHKKIDPGPAWPWRETEKYLESKAALERPELLDYNYRTKERIKAIQSHVHRCGINIGNIDGVWGTMTEAGVKTMLERYNNFYKLELSLGDIKPENSLKLCNAFRLIPGFDSPAR